jgi:hypothetical protein
LDTYDGPGKAIDQNALPGTPQMAAIKIPQMAAIKIPQMAAIKT